MSVCLICQNELKQGEPVTKLVNGRIRKNIYGGYQFIVEDAFETQGYIHLECFLSTIRKKSEPEKVTTLAEYQ